MGREVVLVVLVVILGESLALVPRPEQKMTPEESLPVYTGCNNWLYNVPEGIIDYPGDGSNYPNNVKCKNSINNPSGLDGSKLEVSFQRFSTFNSKDFLQIKNGPKGSAIGTYSGSSLPPTFITEGKLLYLFFKSDSKGTNKPGFKLTWRTYVEPEKINQCEGTTEENSILWNKINSSETAIMDNLAQGNTHLEHAMDIKMEALEKELESIKNNQSKVLNDLTEANSKLDYIMKHLGSCEKPPAATKPPITKPPTATNPSAQRCTCGIPNSPTRIVGGQDVEAYRYPWHVGLYSYTVWYDYFCGGTIINSLYVLSAAHCLSPEYPSNLIVGIGDHNQSSADDNILGLTQFFTVEKVFVHQLFDDVSLDYDFALIQLSEPIEFADGFGIRPICLPDNDASTYEDDMAVTLGWGATNYSSYYGSSDYPDILQEVEVQVLDPDCNYVYENLTDSMMCAASPDKDACSGDSGGSLAISNNGQYTQIGVTSWGYGCALAVFPGVYGRVTSVLQWIKGLSSNGQWCSASVPPSYEPPQTPSPPPKPVSSPSGSTCSCGVPNYPNRIINGKPVQPHKYPWHVGLYSKKQWNKYFCGGTLINSLFVLTAAHCLYPSPNDDLYASIGDHKQTITSDDQSFTQKIKVADYVIHRSYDDDSIDYDFALLKLSTHIQFNGEFGIRPICLPKDNEINNEYTKEMGRILGWGKDENNDFPNTLHEADVEVLSPTSCKNDYPGQITNRMLCAASPGKDACSGDSGGSIAVLENGQYVQVGITSWGSGCADPNFSGVYARVTAALAWIKENAKEGNWCEE